MSPAPRLFACAVRDRLGDPVMGCHVMARDTDQARTLAGATYERQRSPAHLAQLRAADPEHGGRLADHLAGLPPLAACRVEARTSRVKNPSDWATDMATEGAA